LSKREVDVAPSQLPSGRHGLSRDYVQQSQRARLLGGAIRVAGTHGYSGMTVTAVILYAGVSRKTFYDFFSYRESCFLAALDVVLERGLRGVRHAYDGAEAWPERLRAAFAWMLHALAACPQEARIAFVEVLAAGPEALTRRDAARVELASLIAPCFAAAPRRPALPLLLPEAIVGGLSEVVGTRIRTDRLEQLPELLPELMYCALAPFMGPTEAAQLAGLRRGTAARR
jgi:AcrR family transcriptional regulator